MGKQKKMGEGLTSVATHTTNVNLFAAGSESGNISILDIRNLSKVIDTKDLHVAPVHGLTFGNNILTSSANDKTVALWSLDSARIRIFQAHNDDVRSVMWSSDMKTLYPCGW